MVDKKILLMTILLMMAAAAVLLSDKMRKGASENKEEVAEGLDFLKVDKIELETSENKLSLSKSKDGQWILSDGFPADATKVVRLIENVEKIKLQRAVTSDPNGFKELGLENPNRVNIYQDGKQITALLLGDRRDKGGQYLAMKEGKTAYLGSPELTIDAQSSAWELKKILDLKADFVQKVAFKEVILSRSKKEDPIKVVDLKDDKESSAVSSIATLMTNLTFTNRYSSDYEQAKNAMSKANSVTVDSFDQKTYVIKIGSTGDEANKRFFMSVNVGGSGLDEHSKWLNTAMQSHTFEVSKWQAEKFLKERKDFVESKKS